MPANASVFFGSSAADDDYPTARVYLRDVEYWNGTIDDATVLAYYKSRNETYTIPWVVPMAFTMTPQPVRPAWGQVVASASTIPLRSLDHTFCLFVRVDSLPLSSDVVFSVASPSLPSSYFPILYLVNQNTTSSGVVNGGTSVAAPSSLIQDHTDQRRRLCSGSTSISPTRR